MRKIMAALCAVLLVLFLLSCSGRFELRLEKAGSAKPARASMESKLDDALIRSIFQRMADFSGEEAPELDGPLFDEEAVALAFKARKDIKLESLGMPSPASLKAELSIPDLQRLGSEPGVDKGFFDITEKAGLRSLSFRLDRDNVQRLPDIIPAFDPDLLELLSPPSLYGDEISVQEYRDSVLAIFVGRKNLPALDAASVDIRIVAPGKILSQSGGRMEGNVFIAKLPLLTLLVLEEPYEFSFSWRD